MEHTERGFHCSVCDTKLTVHADSEGHLKVEPCPKCLDKAYSKGYAERPSK
jgi:phage FluMu protein Com